MRGHDPESDKSPTRKKISLISLQIKDLFEENIFG
jgi:hypothetical protein